MFADEHDRPDPYAVLHLAPGCTDDEIKSQWRQLVRVFHPDLHPGEPWYEEEFKKIEAAYEILGDPARRAEFDSLRADPAATAPVFAPARSAQGVAGDRDTVDPPATPVGDAIELLQTDGAEPRYLRIGSYVL